MTPEQMRWLEEYGSQANAFQAGGQAQYDQGSDLELQGLDPAALESLRETEMGGISVDPRYKDAQLEALRSMEERSKQGMTAQDEADMFRLQQQVNTANRGRLGAIQQGMASRGMSGSGMNAALQLQASQDAGEREALAAMEKAGQIQSNKMNAAQSLGQMGGQMRGQEFGEQAQKAQAQDIINRFNTANRVDRQNQNVDVQNRGRSANWDRRNQTTDRNTGAGYDYRRDVLGTNQRVAEVGMNAATQDENVRRLEEQEKYRRKNAWRTAAGALIGGGAAAYGSGGNAQATTAGAQVGGAAGGASYAEGTDFVPYPDGMDENDMFPGDDQRNDVVPAMLSPGEKIVSREQAAYDDYVNRLKASVAEKQANVESAKSGKQLADYGSILTGVLNDFNKGNRKDVVLAANPFKDGSVPQVSRGEVNEVKDYAGPMAADNLARADRELAQGKAEFGQEQGIRKGIRAGIKQDDTMEAQRKQLASSEDPNSPVNKVKAQALSKLSPGLDLTGLTGSQLDSMVGMVKMGISAEEAKARLAETHSKNIADVSVKEAALGAKATPKVTGQNKQDADYVKDLNDWRGGGKPSFEKNLTRLEEAKAKLEKYKGGGYGISGPVSGRMPEALRSEESRTLEQDVKAAAQASMKAALGASFTENEGKRIMAAAYDPSLSPEQNIKKIDAAIKELKDTGGSNESRASYFEEHGTLSGWKPGGGMASQNEIQKSNPVTSGSKGTAHWSESE